MYFHVSGVGAVGEASTEPVVMKPVLSSMEQMAGFIRTFVYFPEGNFGPALNWFFVKTVVFGSKIAVHQWSTEIV